MVDRISMKRFYQYGGRDRFMLTVYTTHPRRIWNVEQVQYPENIYFKENTYFQFSMSLESMCFNTLSSARNKERQMWKLPWASPWDRPKKSLTKTST